VARSIPPRKRKRRTAEFRNSVRLGAVLVALTGINVYVFFFRDDTAVRKVLQPQSTSTTVVDEKTGAIRDSVQSKLPASLTGPNLKTKPIDKKVAGGGDEAPAELDGRVVEGKIGANDTLGTVLAREGFGAVAGNVIKGLGRVFDVRSIKPGDGYVVGFDAEGNPELFEYLPTPVQRYVVTPRDDSDGIWQARKEEKALETRTAEASGVIESSLYDSIHKSGESSALVSLLVDLFAWDINFYIDTHPGDHWKVVVEKQYLGGQFYKYGNIVAAEYGGTVGTFRAFYWNPAPGRAPGRYYDDKGQAIAKTMLKCPLRFVRVSSKFDRNRFHPILHTIKAHLGVDYAAPVGTPVWASAGGKIAEVGMRPGSGNTIVINHANGIATRYYHLLRYAKGLVAGKHVNQKEVIGYVGTTGLSTGPHLHFSVTKNGAFVDPTKIQVAREAPVANPRAFFDAIKPRIAALKALAPAVAKN
jgi:murein DD-endopeptidase MepM/ murein hydrolase activator NlpD